MVRKACPWNPRSKASEKPNEALQSERRNEERLYKVILNVLLYRPFAYKGLSL